ncbi:MAG: substrate-binding domain-containing protein [Clostridiales bacterium]|nr:substrate-binding domain-containing protein [Clostridiales bacterium]
MKRILSILLLSALVLTLVACNGDPKQGPADSAAPAQGEMPAQLWETAPGWVAALQDPAEPPLNVPYHWKQIVQDSPYRLGNPMQSTSPLPGGDYEYAITLGSYPCIDGSTVAMPMAEEFARQHLRLQYPFDIISFNKTHQAYENLIFGNKSSGVAEGFVWLSPSGASPASDEDYPYATLLEESTDLIIVTAPSEEELRLAADNGVELDMRPVCWDAFVFITYLGNPVDSLTIEQLRDIYAGKITNWRELGGEELPINAYSRNPNSGSQTAMENLVMQGTPFAPAILSEEIVDDMSTLLGVASAKTEEGGGLGYTYKYFLFQDAGEGITYSPGEHIKTLSIGGVEPTPENIVQGSYPFSVHYYGIIRKGDEEKAGGRFLDWMLSPEGQACIRQAGYIAMDGSFASFYFDENGFVFPESSERLLTEDDLYRLSNHTYWNHAEHMVTLLGFARNEIYARNGNQFSTPAYAAHYGRYDWYRALFLHKVQRDELSKIEHANIQLIQEWEEMYGGLLAEE